MKRKIYRNMWAGSETYFIPTNPVRSSRNEPSKTGGYGIFKKDGVWKLEKNAVYYSRDLKDPQAFPVVGEIDIESALIQCILSGIDKGLDEPKHIRNTEPER